MFSGYGPTGLNPGGYPVDVFTVGCARCRNRRGDSAMSERRGETRIKPSYPVRIMRDPGLDELPHVRVLNLSEHGLAFVTDSPTRPGDRLRFDAGRVGQMLAKVIGVERLLSGDLRVSCKAIEGRFDIAQPPAQGAA